MKVYLFIIILINVWIGCNVVVAKRPNILLIIADDFGWHDIGYHGSEIKTPTLDKLASDGVKLENYYVQPICTPTRSQLMSGKYQIHTGLQHYVILPGMPSGLPLEDETMANRLKDAGYSTHIVGKWHLGFFKKEYLPYNRGFDSYLGYLNGAEDYYKHTCCDIGCGYDLHDDKENAIKYKGQYSTEIFTTRAQKIATNHAQNEADKPLFMYLPFQSVHDPLQVPSRYTEPYKFIQNENRRQYAGMVSAMDEAIANITKTLKDVGLWDNTLLVFSTDNGGQVHKGGNNYPLRGNKVTLWEGGIRGNGFVSGGEDVLKSMNIRGKVNNELLHVSDWFPTLVTLGGGDLNGLKLDGYDVWASISSGSESPRKEILHNIDPLMPKSGSSYPHAKFDTRVRAAIRIGDYKLLTGDPGVDKWFPPVNKTEGESTKLLFKDDKNNIIAEKDVINGIDTALKFKPFQQKQNVWLFNVKDDPTEHHDLSEKMPEKVMEMLDRLADYNSTAVPCFFPPSDPKSNPKYHGGFWEPWE